MLSEVMEDYLKTIYHLQRGREGRVKTSEIAEAAGVTSPTVTSMLGSLEERGLVDREKYHGVSLTEEGERVALEVIRHHRLLEAYLSEHLDYDWSEVHDEADRLEHHISEEFEQRVAEALDDPDIDPHGSPIPSADLTPPKRRVTEPIHAFETGTVVTVTEVADHDAAVLSYLDDNGVRPGAALEIVDVAPFDMITVCTADDDPISLPKSVADHVHASPSEE